MATEMKDLQKLIEKRAEGKLDQELCDLHELLYNQKLLSPSSGSNESTFPNLGTKNTFRDKSEFAIDSIHRLFGADKPRMESYNIWGIYAKRLKEYWLPIYIQRESEEFLKKVDQVVQDVNYLLDNQPSQ